ncbi:MAG: glycoside hydrolase family 32 protein [Verrucomicrobiae bacterium]|nr:glycoside hydrolase family 32 protein [Verrucomicrobiae bacterium]
MSPRRALSLCKILCDLAAAPLSVGAPAEVVIADFEAEGFGGWETAGEAFASPFRPTPDRRPGGLEGERMAWSGASGAVAKGALLSPKFAIGGRYINFLIRGQRDFARVLGAELLVDGRVARSACATDDRGSAALHWRTWDVKDLRGSTARVRINDQSCRGDVAADHFVQGDHPRAVPCDATRLLDESHRPQFHYTALAHWLNDPNGLLFYGGTWHMFHQHRHPDFPGTVWAHAASPDLMHWRHLPVAIGTDSEDSNFSGSGLVDWANASGLKRGDDPPILLFYTLRPPGPVTVTNATPNSPRATQCMALSTDGAKTFEKFSENPILRTRDCQDRDPKVFFHAPTRAWIMVLSLSRNNADREAATFGIFRSKDLRRWELAQEVGPGAWYWECPDMFEMPLDGDPARTKWLLLRGSGEYILGAFDGHRFTPESGPIRNRWGASYYATQTFSDAPGGRRVQIGWMNTGKERAPNSYPGMPFNQQMSIPRELVLRSTPEGPRLFREPVGEIAGLYARTHRFGGRTLAVGENPLAGISHDLLDIEADIALGTARAIRLTLRGEPVEYDVKERRLKAFGVYAPVACPDGRLHLRVLLDRASIEVFANGGEADLSGIFFPDPENREMSLVAEGGAATLDRLDIRELQSVWQTAP